jgi:hypothetical protein
MRFTDPSTLCLFLLAIVVVFLMFRTRVRLSGNERRTDGNRGGSHGVPPPGRETNATEHDLARWEVQLHETARELSAQLDAKLSLLQSLTAEADRAAERLEAALDRTHGTTVLAPGSQAESLCKDAGVDLIARDMADIAGPASKDADAEPGPSYRTDRAHRREEIYHLADYGFAPTEIARRVGSPVGEVELILSLRQN